MMTKTSSLAMRWLAVVLCGAVLLAGCGSEPKETKKPPKKKRSDSFTVDRGPEDLPEKIEALTGAPTKLVWSFHLNPAHPDTYAAGSNHILVGIDTQDGQGVRVIRGDKESYGKPMITPSGTRIVYSDKNTEREGKKKFYAPEIHVVNWDGTEDKLIKKGFAVDVWRDFSTGTDWVYALREFAFKSGTVMEANELFRFPIDEPESEESLWTQTAISPDNMQLSKDGKRISGQFPWPEGGYLDLEKKQMVKTSRGCWTSMAPDNSYISWVFDGAHRNFQLHEAQGGKMHDLPVTGAPGSDDMEVYHPRWSNHAQYFVMTGPYAKSDTGNPISRSSNAAEVYIGKFKEDMTGVEDWIRLTTNEQGDLFPDMWIYHGEKGRLNLPEAQGGDIDEGVNPFPWPPDPKGLEYVWENVAGQNQIPIDAENTRFCRAEAKGMARYGRYYDMLLEGGYFLGDEASGEGIAEACRKSDAFTMEVLVTEKMTGKYEASTRILSYRMDEKNDGFALFRTYENLVLRVFAGGRDYPIELGHWHIERDRPMHVMMTYDKGRVVVYVDGRDVRTLEIDGKTLDWQNGRVVVGDPEPFGTGWEARAEGIAIYSRALSMAEVGETYRHVREKVGRLRPLKKVRMQATLTEMTPIPDPESLGAYRRSLVDATYDVERVLSGRYDAKTISVLHWCILDRKVVPGMPLKEGETYELLLEVADEHPELKSENKELGSLDFNAALYYDISDPRTYAEPKAEEKKGLPKPEGGE